MAQLGPETIDALAQNALPGAFERVAERRWVSQPAPAIKGLFEFDALKGDVYSARWGFSVDFVPALKGRTLAWKRTVSKAAFDLCIDPIDASGDVPAWCSFSGRDSPARVAAAARKAAEAALADLNAVTSLAGIADLFRKRSAMTFSRFSLANYVQTDLAWGLLSLSLGDEAEGAERLARFCEQFGIAPDTAILKKAEAEARGIARN